MFELHLPRPSPTKDEASSGSMLYLTIPTAPVDLLTQASLWLGLEVSAAMPLCPRLQAALPPQKAELSPVLPMRSHSAHPHGKQAHTSDIARAVVQVLVMGLEPCSGSPVPQRLQ